MTYIFLLTTAFVSGLLLWDYMGVSWETQRWLLLLHAPVSLFLVAVYLLPYMFSHISYHLPKIKNSKTASIKQGSGVFLTFLITAVCVSGLWLMFVGQTGDTLGYIAWLLHLTSSFAVVAFAFLHILGKTKKVNVSIASIVVAAVIFSPTKSDALEPHKAGDTDMRASIARGEKLFYSSKESGVEGLLMGDSSKSCASCHKGGFNDTNRLLFFDAKVDPKKSAVIGHKNIKNFFAKDFVKDYISAIIEQGGKVSNPDNPSSQITRAMGDLHLFIRSRSNLPFFSTWVRLDENKTRYSDKEWLSSASCKKCHPEIFKQWANSNHRLMGGSNPYYMALEDLAAKEEGEGIRFWCMGCHSPLALTTGRRKTSHTSHLFDKDGKALVESLKEIDREPEEGTSCLFCHRITKLEEVRGNGGYTINLQDREKYILEERDGAFGWAHDSMINAKPKLHAQSYSKDFYKDSKYCMSCHDEFSPGKGAKIVDTYGEWERSNYNKGAGNPKTKGCVDCHMSANPANPDKKVSGYSTEGGRLKDGVKTHHFAGSNHFLVGLRSKEHEKMTITMLKAAAKIEAKTSKNELTIRVSNVGAGHSLPTGVADFRELWLEVMAVDRDGKTVLQSGRLDKNGEIQSGARIFRKVYGDKDGKPVELKFWKYEKLLEDTRIAANGFRDETYKIDPSAKYPVKIEAKLNFRIYPQWVTTYIQKEHPYLPTPPVITLHRILKTADRP